MTSVWATVRRWCLGLGCAALLVIALLPWAQSGDRQRNSFALLRSADRLDLIDGVVQRTAQIGWLLMPVVVGVVVIALALQHHTVASLGAGYVGLTSVAMAVLVGRSSLDRSAWPAFALLLGMLIVAVAIVDLLQERKFSRVSTKPAVGDVSAP